MFYLLLGYFGFGWYLWVYDKVVFNYEFNIFKRYIIEKDLEFYSVRVLNKDLDHLLVDRFIKVGLISFIVLLFTKSIIISFICFILFYIGYYYYLKKQYQLIIKKTNEVFPYYLNSLAILIQQNPIVVALNKSIDDAPIVFKEELRVLVYQIHHNPNSIIPYIEFAKKFEEINDINRIMRTLYNIALKASNRAIMITTLSKITNEKLNNQLKLDYQRKLDKQQMIPYLLFLWLGLLIVNMVSTISLF